MRFIFCVLPFFSVVDGTSLLASTWSPLSTNRPITRPIFDNDTAATTPVPYLITTRAGTDNATFGNFTKTLDGGLGQTISYPTLTWQSYVVNLTSAQATIIAKYPFIDYITIVVENISGDTRNSTNMKSTILQKRVPAEFDERPDSASHLKLISQPKSTFNYPSEQLPNYLFDPTLGKGSTIYIIDSGCRLSHTEFNPPGDRTIRTYIVPNILTLGLISSNQDDYAPEDATDYDGHGTAVTSVAAGRTLGVASRANLVIVKTENALAVRDQTGRIIRYDSHQANPASIQDGFDWVFNDVNTQRGDPANADAKFIISFQTDVVRGLPHLANYEPVLATKINQAIAMDIVPVISAGNHGQTTGTNLALYTPPNLGTISNGLITVGGVTEDGILDPDTTPDFGLGGSISVYAKSENVEVASSESDTEIDLLDGTSYASPQVAGLAAYFFGLVSLTRLWRAGSVSLDMKSYITSNAWRRSQNPIPPGLRYENLGVPDSFRRGVDGDPIPVFPPNAHQTWVTPAADTIKVAWNQAPDGLCFGARPVSRNRRSAADVPVIVNGTVIASNISMALCTAPDSGLGTSPDPPVTSSTLVSSASPPDPTANTTSAAPPSPPNPTPAPDISCVYQDMTPEKPAACTCKSGTSTTVVRPMTLSSVTVITQSCDFTTWPKDAPPPTTALPAISTNFAGCQVCTIFNPAEADCEPLPSSLDCTPKSTSTILSADTAGVTVGTLTGTALFSAITSAIDQVCEVPINTGAAIGSYTCTESATATLASNIQNTDEASSNFNDKGILTLQITEASYDSLEWYSASKARIAAFALNSTQGNCKDTTAMGDDIMSGSAPVIGSEQETLSICQAGSHFQLVEIDPNSNGSARELSFGLRFTEPEKDNPIVDIDCEFLIDAAEFVESSINVLTDTEAALPGEVEVDQKLLKLCEGKDP